MRSSVTGARAAVNGVARLLPELVRGTTAHHVRPCYRSLEINLTSSALLCGHSIPVRWQTWRRPARAPVPPARSTSITPTDAHSGSLPALRAFRGRPLINPSPANERHLRRPSAVSTAQGWGEMPQCPLRHRGLQRRQVIVTIPSLQPSFFLTTTAVS